MLFQFRACLARKEDAMPEIPDFAAAASLIADPARALMLTALLDGRALPAGELAYAARIAPQTASSHLAKLLSGGLLAVETEGRHRYYRLAGGHVAEALEHLAMLGPVQPVRRKAISGKARQLRYCRCCYDHLAGQVGVAVTQGLAARGYLTAAPDKQFRVTDHGSAWFGSIGVDVKALRPTARGLARQCLDWTERAHHLAGPLGVDLLRAMCAKGWLRRSNHTRVVEVTPRGWLELKRQLDVDLHADLAA
jgi:DNA-binding transcriptional ArsR family regulator